MSGDDISENTTQLYYIAFIIPRYSLLEEEAEARS